MKKIFALAILTSIAAAPAMAETFTRDGLTYDYTIKAAGDATVISGKIVDNGESFRLTVKGGRVDGQVGSRPVSFRTDSLQSASATGGTVFAAK